MNPKTSVRQIAICWTPAEIYSIAATAFRDLAAEASAAGTKAAAVELERLAVASEGRLDAARSKGLAWFEPTAQGRGGAQEVTR